MLEEALNVASYFLQKSGEFFPFAVALEAGGGLRNVEGFPGGEQPPSVEVLAIIEAGIAQGAATGEFLGAAFVSDVRIVIEGKKTDAVRVQIEHCGMPAVVAFLPYSLGNGQVAEGSLLFEKGDARCFPA
jgi:hypothetical protein